MKGKELHDEFTTAMHNDLLKNKQADQYSKYVTYQRNVELFGVEYALECMGLKKPPREPL
jgi:hypothetical protein